MTHQKPTALQLLLADKIKTHQHEISAWHLEHAQKTTAPLYCSVDIRDAGFKIAPVDSNLYPAGFNNLCADDLRAARPLVRAQLEAISQYTGISKHEKVLIIPENHTSNSYYIENLYFLKELISESGFEVCIGWLSADPASEKTIQLTSNSGKIIAAELIESFSDHEGKKLKTHSGFIPDLILLNNDFSSGYPHVLDHLEQPVLPSHTLGWHSRTKSRHFEHYNRLIVEFSKIIGIDPWLLSVDTEQVTQVNFSKNIGIDRVRDKVTDLLNRTRIAYKEHGIHQAPFAFVKNDQGTYGMGIMVVRSSDELSELNSRTRNKMSVGKNHLQIESLAIQEGIPTATLVDRLAAEPVIYLMGYELMGGFLRTNTERGAEDNLNSKGMTFKRLCMAALKESLENSNDIELNHELILELVYGEIARISALAAGYELKERENQQTC